MMSGGGELLCLRGVAEAGAARRELLAWGWEILSSSSFSMGSMSGLRAAWHSHQSSGNDSKITPRLKCVNERKGQNSKLQQRYSRCK